MKHKLILLLFVFVSVFSQDKNVKISVNASEIFQGDVLEVEIAFENFDEHSTTVDLPNFDDLKLITGPFTSTSSQISSINGKTTVMKTITYTYRFVMENVGTIKIGPATAEENGKTYKSNVVNVKVYKKGEEVKNNLNDLFIKTTVSKKDIYLGETVRIDYELYVSADKTIRRPSLIEDLKYKGFVKDEIKISPDKQNKLVQKIDKGRKYGVLALKSLYLTATSSGTQDIEPMILSVPLEQKQNSRRSRVSDPFYDNDLFSNFRITYKDVPITSEKVKINVKELPKPAPEGFSGIVGDFDIDLDISSNNINVNEALTLKTVIKGSGAIRNITYPNFSIPSEFETYEPEKKERGTISGSVTFSQVIIPRMSGEYVIPAYDFIYFSPKTGKYETKKIYEIKITVTGEESSFASSTPVKRYGKRDVDFIGHDIRYIKNSVDTYYPEKSKVISFKSFWIYVLVAIILPLISLILSKIFTKEENREKVRRKKALKVAEKRLKTAKSYLKSNDKIKFFEEVDRVIYNYLADKFGLSASGIILDEIYQKLLEYEVDIKTVDSLKELLDKAGLVKYAPSSLKDEDISLDTEKVKEIIIEIEEKVR